MALTLTLKHTHRGLGDGLTAAWRPAVWPPPPPPSGHIDVASVSVPQEILTRQENSDGGRRRGGGGGGGAGTVQQEGRRALSRRSLSRRSLASHLLEPVARHLPAFPTATSSASVRSRPMSGTAETVPELCSYRGCALPRGHQAACEAELMHGKRRRIPSCLRETSPGSRSNATHSYRRSQSPDDHCGLCSKQSKRQSAAANSHRNCTSIVVPVPSKQVAFADSEVSCTAKLLRCKPAAVQGAEVDHESLHQNRVTVWYINRRRREAWHGHVTHVCPQRGILVCFQRLPHTAKSNCEEAWVCPREDEWNWGHSDLRCPDSISDGQLRNVLDSMEARIATLNQSDGAKAWPKVFRSCIHRLEVIQLGVTSAEWLNTASCSALDGFDMLHRCGITGLVSTAKAHLVLALEALASTICF